jgi:hypothetical protein
MDSRNDRRRVADPIRALRRAALFAVVILLHSVASAEQIRVKESRVNLRRQPSTNSDLLVPVMRGDTLTVVERTGSWYLVKSPDGKRGYIHENSVEPITLRTPATGASGSASAASPVPSEDFQDSVREAQERSFSQKRRERGLYKMLGGAAGVVTGIFVMDSSTPVGIGLMGAGGWFLWDGFDDRRAESRRVWNVGLQVGRDQAGVVYAMSW